MFRRVSLWIGCGVLLAASLQASQASAQIGIGPGAYGLGFYNFNSNHNGGNDRIPYYALYPPVYYSYPVPRTYGYSPFAYPPGTITPAAPPRVAAVDYINPFVQETGGNGAAPAPAPVGKAEAVDPTASLPRMYYNPYVQTAGK
jgi:hypothetical protein